MTEANVKDRILEKRYERHVKNSLDRVTNKVQKEELKSWIMHLKRKNVKILTIRGYTRIITHFALFINKDFRDAEKSDIENYLNQFINKSPYTRNQIAIIIKSFYQFLYGMRKGRYPDVVDWIENVKIPPPDDIRKILFTTDEIMKILKAEDDLRLRALWAVLFESGCRPHEIYNQQIQDLEFDQFGIRFQVPNWTKTGPRNIRLVKAVSYLKAWLNEHPDRNNPAAYIWRRRARNIPILPDTMNKYFKRACKKAGVRVRNLYVTRKQCYCRVANMPELNEIQAKGYMGHSPTSASISRYIFVDEEQIDHTLVQAAGVSETVGDVNIKQRVRIGELPTPKICPECRASVRPDVRFCPKCEFDFENIESTLSVEKLKKELQKRDEEIKKFKDEIESLKITVSNIKNALTQIYSKIN